MTYEFTFIFSYSSKWPARIGSELIKLRLGTAYSHVSLAISTGPIGTIDVYQASHGDVNIVDQDHFLQKNRVVFVRKIKVTREEMIRGIRYAKKQTGKKYSFWAAIAATFQLLRKLKIGSDGDVSFICSEYTVRIVEETFGLKMPRPFEQDYVDPKLFEEFLDAIIQARNSNTTDAQTF